MAESYRPPTGRPCDIAINSRRRRPLPSVVSIRLRGGATILRRFAANDDPGGRARKSWNPPRQISSQRNSYCIIRGGVVVAAAGAVATAATPFAPPVMKI